MKKLFLLSIAALSFASCSNELDTEIQNLLEKEVITAQIPEGMSRTTTEALKVLWADGDQIGVFRTKSEVETGEYVNNCFTLSDGSGTIGASFTAEQASGVDNVFAYYPYNANAEFNGTNMTITLPKEQNYDDGNQLVMVGEFEEGSSAVSFKNAMALAVITVKNIPANYSKAVLTASDEEYLAGTAKANIGDNGATLAISSNGSKTLTINFGNNTETEKRFYFAIPADTYDNGLTMTLEGDNVEPYVVGTLKDAENTTSFTPEVNDFFYHNIELNAGVTTIKEVSTVEELKAAFAAGGSYILTQDITAEEALTFGSGDMILDLGGKTLKIEGNTINNGLINNGKLTIKNGSINFNGSTANGAAIRNNAQIQLDNVNVTSETSAAFRNYGSTVQSLTNQSAESATITAVINGGTFASNYCKTESHETHRYAIHAYMLSNLTMTGSTVQGSGGVSVDVSFATLTNVTATHTCTHGAHDLYVACGNATMSDCTFNNMAAYSDDQYGKAVINGTIYENGTTGIGNIAAKDALTSAFANGGSYVLTSDVTIEEALTLASGTMVLDLDGNTLKIEGNTINNGLINNGKLTIKNGSINFNGSTANGAAIRNNAQIQLDNVNVTSETSAAFRNYGSTVQSLTNQSAESATITAVINGGTFASNYCKTESHETHRYAIHAYMLSNLTMTGSTVQGSGGVSVDVSFATLTNVTATHTCTHGAHDLYVACGNATVEECTFANAAAYSDATYGNAVVNGQTYQHDTNNSNGTTVAINLGSN